MVADPIAKSTVVFRLGERGDDVGERAEVDAAADFDRLDAEGEAQMSISVRADPSDGPLWRGR